MVHPLAVAFWANNMDTGNRVQNVIILGVSGAPLADFWLSFANWLPIGQDNH